MQCYNSAFSYPFFASSMKRNVCIMLIYWALQWSCFAWVNALCNLSCKKLWEVTASVLGWFLSRCCFTLCITVEVEPRIAKQYKCCHCCSCKNNWGKGMEGGKKCLCVIFWLTSSWKQFILGHPIAWATIKLLLVARHILTTSLQKCL